MKRLIALSCVVVMAFGLVGCGKQTESSTFIMADKTDGDHPTAVACDEFAQMVNEKTNGRVNIEVYHGDALGTESEQIQQITVDGIDFAEVAVDKMADYENDFNAFKGLYLYESEDAMWKVLNGSVGNSYLDSANLKKNNIVGLSWFSEGARDFYNNKKAIAETESFDGLKFAINMDSIDKFIWIYGAKDSKVAENNIYNSIKDGDIDGAESNLYTYMTMNYYKVAKYITIDRHSCIPSMLVVSSEALKKMSPEDQKTVKECAKEVSKNQIKAMNEYETGAIAQAKKEGCVITSLTKEQAAQFKEASAGINKNMFPKLQTVIKKITGK